MKKFIAITTFLVATAVPALASAEIVTAKSAEKAVHITYSMNDLANKSGRDELKRQIRRAAEKVCGPQTLRGAISLAQLAENRTCYREAVEEALGSIPAIG